MADHRGIPHNPDNRDSLGRQRRMARCEVCGLMLRRVSALRGVTAWNGTGERRIEWHHVPPKKPRNA